MTTKMMDDSSKKRPYQAPKLVVYGDLTEMTLLMIGNPGMMEALFMMKRT